MWRPMRMRCDDLWLLLSEGEQQHRIGDRAAALRSLGAAEALLRELAGRVAEARRVLDGTFAPEGRP